MSILTQLHQASFDGVVFLIDSSRTEGGRKTATHEFVNSDNRTTEDLGRLLKTFKIKGTISGSGQQYFIDRDRLITALEGRGSKVLEHPFFGRVNVVAKPYTLIEELTDLGAATFDMVFERSDSVILPQPDLSSLTAVSTAATAAAGECTADVASVFNQPTGLSANPESQKKSESLLGKVSETFSRINNQVVGSTEDVASLNSLVSGFSSDIVALTSNPQALSNEILKLVNAVDITLQADLSQALTIFGDLFDFNRGSSNIGRATDIGSTGNTISTVEAEIILNEQVVTRQLGMAALTFAYTDIAITEFNNVDELEAAQDVLEEEFQFLYDDQTMPSNTLLSLQKLRDEANKFFEQQKLTINDITSIDIKRMPSQVLTYALYGNLDLAQEIVDLNNNPDVSFYDGTILALTE